MGPLMYKQRPAYPALVGAVCVLAFGGLVCWGLNERVQAGLGDLSQIILTASLCCGIAGALVITAFARYQFTHLWKKAKPRSSGPCKPRFKAGAVRGR